MGEAGAWAVIIVAWSCHTEGAAFVGEFLFVGGAFGFYSALGLKLDLSFGLKLPQELGLSLLARKKEVKCFCSFSEARQLDIER